MPFWMFPEGRPQDRFHIPIKGLAFRLGDINAAILVTEDRKPGFSIVKLTSQDGFAYELGELKIDFSQIEITYDGRVLTLQDRSNPENKKDYLASDYVGPRAQVRDPGICHPVWDEVERWQYIQAGGLAWIPPHVRQAMARPIQYVNRAATGYSELALPTEQKLAVKQAKKEAHVTSGELAPLAVAGYPKAYPVIKRFGMVPGKVGTTFRFAAVQISETELEIGIVDFHCDQQIVQRIRLLDSVFDIENNEGSIAIVYTKLGKKVLYKKPQFTYFTTQSLRFLNEKPCGRELFP